MSPTPCIHAPWRVILWSLLVLCYLTGLGSGQVSAESSFCYASLQCISLKITIPEN